MTKIVLTTRKNDDDGAAIATRCHCTNYCTRLVYYNGGPAVETDSGLIVPEHVSEKILDELGGPMAMVRMVKKLKEVV